ncbi:uncharacterized protein LOC144346712, partial [Saccoglossus kowalevskii]
IGKLSSKSNRKSNKHYGIKIQDYNEERRDLKKKLKDIKIMKERSHSQSPTLQRPVGSVLNRVPRRPDSEPSSPLTTMSKSVQKLESTPPETPPTPRAEAAQVQLQLQALKEKKTLEPPFSVPTSLATIQNSNISLSGSSSPTSSPSDSPLLQRVKSLHVESPLQIPRPTRRVGHWQLLSNTPGFESKDVSTVRPRQRAMTTDSTLIHGIQQRRNDSPRLLEVSSLNQVAQTRSRLQKYDCGSIPPRKAKQISLNFNGKSNGGQKQWATKLSSPQSTGTSNRSPLLPRRTKSGKPPLLRARSSETLMLTTRSERPETQHDVDDVDPESSYRLSQRYIRRTSSLEDLSTLIAKMEVREDDDAVTSGGCTEKMPDSEKESVKNVPASSNIDVRQSSKWDTVRSKFKLGGHTENRVEQRNASSQLKKIVNTFMKNGRTVDIMKFEKLRQKDHNDNERPDSLDSLEECRYLRKYIPKFYRDENEGN